MIEYFSFPIPPPSYLVCCPASIVYILHQSASQLLPSQGKVETKAESRLGKHFKHSNFQAWGHFEMKTLSLIVYENYTNSVTICVAQFSFVEFINMNETYIFYLFLDLGTSPCIYKTWNPNCGYPKSNSNCVFSGSHPIIMMVDVANYSYGASTAILISVSNGWCYRSDMEFCIILPQA